MAVFRIEKNRAYTVMANHHLRNTALSLKAKGGFSPLCSLCRKIGITPQKGLARICKDGVDSISTTVKELEQHGYIIRERIRNSKGQLTTIEYTILEQPKPPLPKQEKPAQLNTKKSSNQKSTTDLSSTEQSNPYEPQAAAGIGMDTRETYREIILENIEYDILIQDRKFDRDRLDEIVGLLVDTVCSARQSIRISEDDFPAEVVKSLLLKLDSSHIQYVLDCMEANTTYVRNIKKYLLAALFNSPATIGNYYSALKFLLTLLRPCSRIKSLHECSIIVADVRQ